MKKRKLRPTFNADPLPSVVPTGLERSEQLYVVNPFVSEAQRRACYAADDPDWDCEEWEAATDGKKLPARKAAKKRKGKLKANRGPVGNAKRRPNPLKYDPTRTLTLRRSFCAQLRRQFAILKGRIVKLIVDEDAFGLKEAKPLSFNSLEPDPEMALEHLLIEIAKEAYRRKTESEDGSPDYGQLFFKSETREVWYCGADGDTSELFDWLEPLLEEKVGKDHVTIEAESFPPRDEGWVQLFPKRKPVTANFNPDQPRDEHGRFGSGGSTPSAETSGRYNPKAPDAPKGSLLARMKSSVSSRLPPWVQRWTAKLTKAAFVLTVAGNKAVQAVAKERGLSPEKIAKLSKVVGTVDVATGGSRAGGIATAVGLGALALPASLVPWGSVSYLAYSTARNPLATLRAARNGIQSAVRKLRGGSKSAIPATNDATTCNLSQSDIETIEDALSAHDYSDWYVALLHCALDHAPKDVHEAITLANAAHEDQPEDTSSPQEDDGEAVFGKEPPKERNLKSTRGVENFNPDQERDASGRFAGGGDVYLHGEKVNPEDPVVRERIIREVNSQLHEVANRIAMLDEYDGTEEEFNSWYRKNMPGERDAEHATIEQRYKQFERKRRDILTSDLAKSVGYDPEEHYTENFDPDQARDEHGRWTKGGGGVEGATLMPPSPAPAPAPKSRAAAADKAATKKEAAATKAKSKALEAKDKAKEAAAVAKQAAKAAIAARKTADKATKLAGKAKDKLESAKAKLAAASTPKAKAQAKAKVAEAKADADRTKKEAAKAEREAKKAEKSVASAVTKRDKEAMKARTEAEKAKDAVADAKEARAEAKQAVKDEKQSTTGPKASSGGKSKGTAEADKSGGKGIDETRLGQLLTGKDKVSSDQSAHDLQHDLIAGMSHDEMKRMASAHGVDSSGSKLTLAFKLASAVVKRQAEREQKPVDKSAVAREPVLTPGQTLTKEQLRERLDRLAPMPERKDTPAYHPALRRRVDEMKRIMSEVSEDHGSVHVHGMGYAEPMRGFSVSGVKVSWAANVTTAAESLVHLMDRSIHETLWKANERVVLTTQRNKDDPYWGEKMGGGADFVAAATGGDGTICVYNGAACLPSTFAHESGHNLAHKIWGTVSPPANSPYGKAQGKEHPVTFYGSNNHAEDFAEACMLFCASKEDPKTLADKERRVRAGDKGVLLASYDHFRVHWPLKFEAIHDIMERGTDKPTYRRSTDISDQTLLSAYNAVKRRNYGIVDIPSLHDELRSYGGNYTTARLNEHLLALQDEDKIHLQHHDSPGNASRRSEMIEHDGRLLGFVAIHPGHERKLLGNTTLNTRWKFNSDPDKVKAFQQWMSEQLDATLLSSSQEQQWRAYIEAGYRKGAGRAFDDGKAAARGQQTLDYYAGTRDEFLRSTFAQPVSVERVKLLAGRSYDDLENVTSDMSTRMSRSLVDGLIQGKSPHEIARDLSGDLDLSRSRAETIARTEIVRAHAEGQLDSMQQLGVDEVGVQVEWLATEDGNQCDECSDLEGSVLPIDEARGMLPRHPNCRCCWIPAIGDLAANSVVGNAKDYGSGRWVTLEDSGQHVFISGEGEFLPKGPSSGKQTKDKAGGKVGTSKQDGSKDTSGKTQGGSPGKPQYAAISRQSVRDRLKAGTTDEEREAIALEILNNHARPPAKLKALASHGMDKSEDMHHVEIDEVQFHFPSAPGGARLAAQSLAKIFAVGKIPDAIWSANRHVVFTSQKCSFNDGDEQKMGITGFSTDATAGVARTICVFPPRGVDKRLFGHESAHNLAEKLGWPDLTPPKNSPYGRAQKLEEPVTEYGATHPAEDFAEACGWMTIAPKDFRAKFPHKAAALDKLLGTVRT
jgi:SPP1 gp7 family putative phage head morphogenesis protein